MSNRPRVAILTPHSLARGAGGMEIFTKDLAEALRGARVFAPSVAPKRSPSALDHVGLEQPRQAAEPARALRRSWRTEPYDLVICNGLSGWPLTLAPLPSPTVEVYHITLAAFAQKALRRRADRFTTARVGGFFDRLAGAGKSVVSVSDSVGREVSTLYGHRSTVLPNGVDVTQFREGNRDEARERLKLPRESRVALYVGRPEYAKGFDHILELARAMKQVLFVSVSAATSGPENLRFYSDVPHERMPLLYAAADVFLLPSRYEGFNLSLLEAMACGLPAVTSAAGYPFARGAETLATVVDPLTTEGLARAAWEAMERGMRMDVRERIVREYSMDAFRTRWVDFVQQTVAR